MRSELEVSTYCVQLAVTIIRYYLYRCWRQVKDVQRPSAINNDLGETFSSMPVAPSLLELPKSADFSTFVADG